MDRLHLEMDALLADAASPKLSAEQQMLLRQNEISNRAQMDSMRGPVTASIDRVMQRDGQAGRGNPPGTGHPQEMGGMPPQLQARQQQDEYDAGIFGFKCFRACT